MIVRDEKGRFTKESLPLNGFKKGNIPWNKGLACSGMSGKHQSEKQKQIVSELMKGKIVSLKTRQKIRVAAKKRVGEKASNWKDGISFLPYPAKFNKELKELIRSRDSYKCQLCNVPQKECLQNLCVHHIDYNKENCLPSNLISLCHGCNSVANGDREYWQRFFMDLLKKKKIKT